MPYVVDDQEFRTKDDLTERARSILYATPDGSPVAEVDRAFLVALLQHHDEWEEKSAGGIVDLSTNTTQHGTRCFVLRKGDGSSIDISFPHAIRLIRTTRSKDLLPQALRDFRNAARSAIAQQINAFREQELQTGAVCPVSGQGVTRANSSVDHAPPKTFDALLFEFCKERSLNPLLVKVESDRGVVAVLADAELLAAWQAFHREKAELRLTTKLGNLQQPKSRMTWSDLWAYVRDT